MPPPPDATGDDYNANPDAVEGAPEYTDGFDSNGEGAVEYDAEGYDADGYDADGYDADGYDADGFDAEGYDADGYDAEGNPAEWLNAQEPESAPAPVNAPAAANPHLSGLSQLTADLSDDERQYYNDLMANDLVAGVDALIARRGRQMMAGSAATSIHAQRIASEAPDFYQSYAPGIQMALTRMQPQQAATEEGMTGAIMGAVLADALSGKGYRKAILDAADALRKSEQARGPQRPAAPRRPQEQQQEAQQQSAAPRRPAAAPRVSPRAARPNNGASVKGADSALVAKVAKMTGQDKRTVRRNLQQDGRL